MRCTRCLRELAVTEFYVDRTRLSGRQNRCKDCERARRRNPAVERARQKRWISDPENYAKKLNWNTTRRSATSTVSTETVEVYALVQAGTDCHYCTQPATHVDHYFPLAKGGRHVAENLVPACSECNLKKYNRCGTWYSLRV